MPVIKTITIKKTLESDTIVKPKPAEKKWRYLGSVSLSGKTDNMNIRDFAHYD